MPHSYLNRDTLKTALGVPATSTGGHARLDAVIETVSRAIDRYTGRWFYPRVQTRFYTARETTCLAVDDLLSVTALHVDASGGYSYGTTVASDDYWLEPYNATLESPPRPYTELAIRENSTAVFPTDIRRGVRAAGSWGWYDERETATAVLSTAANATVTTLALSGTSNVHPGQTLLIGSEQVYVTEVNPDNTIIVKRGQNGTSATSYSSGQGFEVYVYPLIGGAALQQAMLDYRAQDAPLGISGGRDFSQEVPAAVGGGLHPIVRRVLDQFRTPTVA